MSNDFLPSREKDLSGWLRNFELMLNASPAAYGVSLEQAAEMQSRAEAFSAALALLDNEGTKSPLNVSKKNVAKTEAVRLARQLARICQSFPGMDDVKRQDLRINVPKPRAQKKAPEFAPLVQFLGLNQRNILAWAKDPNDPLNRGLMADATGVQWYSWIGEEPPTDPRMWFNQGVTFRSRAELGIPGTEATTVWITAAYVNSHGSGPGQPMLLKVTLAANSAVPEQQRLKIAA
jgi:hypothetical protein